MKIAGISSARRRREAAAAGAAVAPPCHAPVTFCISRSSRARRRRGRVGVQLRQRRVVREDQRVVRELRVGLREDLLGALRPA